MRQCSWHKLRVPVMQAMVLSCDARFTRQLQRPNSLSTLYSLALQASSAPMSQAVASHPPDGWPMVRLHHRCRNAGRPINGLRQGRLDGDACRLPQVGLSGFAPLQRVVPSTPVAWPRESRCRQAVRRAPCGRSPSRRDKRATAHHSRAGLKRKAAQGYGGMAKACPAQLLARLQLWGVQAFHLDCVYACISASQTIMRAAHGVLLLLLAASCSNLSKCNGTCDTDQVRYKLRH